jgi:hypothetical protein
MAANQVTTFTSKTPLSQVIQSTGQRGNITFTSNIDATKGILHNLEIASGLLIDPSKITAFRKITIDAFKIHGDSNQYAAELDILVNGQKALGHIWAIDATDPYIIDNTRYKSFVKRMFENHFLEELQKVTPAGQRGELVTGGLLGIHALSMNGMASNPITGPNLQNDSLLGQLLNDIHPGMVDGIENFCNIIRTRSYLTMPPSSFGSLQTFLHKVQGAISSFIQSLYDIYHGVLLYLQRIAIVINGLLTALNQWVYEWINKNIPLDLICAILGATQAILDDVAFFAQLFAGGDGLFNAINSVQTVINYAAKGLSFAYNPISILNLIPGVSDVFAALNQLESDPQAFMGSLISHFGFSKGLQGRAFQIANAILLHYGLESQLGPLGSVLLSAGVAGNSSQWYRTGNTGIGNFGNMAYGNVTPNPTYLDPDNPLGILDINNNQYFNAVGTDLSKFTNNLNDIPGAAGAAANELKTNVVNLFNPNAPQTVAPVTPTPVTGNTAATAQ